MGRVKTWHISDNGQGSGGFLCPPGHWNHRYTLWHGWSYEHADFIGGIDYRDEKLPGVIAAKIAKIKSDAVLVCSEAWLRHTYGYFRRSYAPESGSRRVSDAIFDATYMSPAERHLGYLTVKEFFPDHEPRVDLIVGMFLGYGSWPCVHCGKRVQYEARIDGFEPFQGDKACVADRVHSWE